MLFSGPMVRGILDGSKTQTRRLVKFAKHYPDAALQRVFLELGHWRVFSETLPCPYGWPGDLIWVKETFGQLHDEDGAGYVYRADFIEPEKEDFIRQPWKPSIFMPRVASRILLEITDVRVERLQDISEADAIAEGVEKIFSYPPGREKVDTRLWFKYKKRPPHEWAETAIESYQSLWQSINGPESWNQNPFVWAITFKRVE